MGKFLKKVFSLERVLGMAVLAGLLALQITDPFPVKFARLKTFDWYQQLKPREIPPPEKQPVSIVDLDEKSLAEIGQWPWPRTTVAQMLKNLYQMGAGVVGFDIVFAEPDRMNPQGVAEAIYGLDDATKKRLKGLPSNDMILANVVRKTRTVLGQSGYWEDREIKAGPPARKSIAVLWKGPKGQKVPPQNYVPNLPDMVRNVPVLEKAGKGHGLFTLTPDPGGIVRRVPALMSYNGDLYPALSIEMLRLATGRRTILVETDQAGIRAVKVTKGLEVTTDKVGRMWPYFSKGDKSKYISARDVLAGTADPSKIKGKLVLIGTSAVGLLDIRSVPTEPILPGVEVHAQLLEAILHKKYLSRPNWANGAELTLLLVGGILMIWLVPVIGAKWTLLLFATVSGSAIYGSWHMFSTQQMLFDPVFGSVSILLLYTLLTYTGYAREEKERAQVRGAFGHYLSPAMVEKLAEDPDQLQLGGETRNMTMLFCDVRGFTTISEQFDAEGLTKLINKLLTPLTGVILDRQGTVDKYMGDCIMAFWNAPLDDDEHGRHACLAALEMNTKMAPLNEMLEAEAKEEGRKHIPLKIGTGVNSGDVVVGNMGSDQRFDYSILGDEVNLASRLEGQCKTYRVDIVIGENTESKATDLATLELDLIKVKGKTEAVRIFTLVGDHEEAKSEKFQTLRANHKALLAAYRAQDWETAREKLAKCRELYDGYNLAGLYDVFDERIEEYEKTSPGADWDGVYVAMTK